MAALGNLIGKVAASGTKSVHKTAQYEKLAQDPSDNEEEDDILFQRKSDASITQNGHSTTGEQENIEMDNVLESSNGKPLFSDVKVRLSRPSVLARFRRLSFILSIVFVIGLVILLSLVLPNKSLSHKESNSTVINVSKKQTANWTILINDYGTESVMRVIDVDRDGLEDIIVGMGSTLGKAVVETRQDMHDLCKQISKPYPCGGILLAMRGFDGKELWRIPTFAEVFTLNCGHLDINRDGVPDCIAAGRMSTLFAFDTRNGSILWEGDESVLMVSWNIYTPQVLKDLDGDGIPEVLVPHGGQVITNAEELLEPLPGRLLLVSGATGKTLGLYLEMPGNKETYMSPVLHTRKDGTQYILIGSGGEAVPGSLFIISVADFYRYVKQLQPKEAVPGGYKDPKVSLDKYLTCNKLGVCEIYSEENNGIVVPPVCADITGDSVVDIIFITQEGTLAAYDGDTFMQLWKSKSDGWESYSIPAPGYFNDDNVLDFMVHQNHGQFPNYDKSKVWIVDGKTGSSLWQLETTSAELSSDLVLRTTLPYRDVFLFRLQGRLNPETKPHKTSRRKRVAEEVRERRQYTAYTPQPKPPYYYGDRPRGRGHQVEPGQGRYPSRYSGRGYKQATYDPTYQGSLYGNSLGRQRPNYEPAEPYYNHYSEESYDEAIQDTGGIETIQPTDECEKDRGQYTSEVYMMDRTNKFTPLHIYSIAPEKYYYNMTDELLKILEQNLNLKSLDLNFTPEKFREYTDILPKELSCALWRPQETSTGVLSDVDGDGTLDFVTTVHMDVKLRYGSYPLSKVKTSVVKINLAEAMHRRTMIPMGPKVPPASTFGRLVPGAQQEPDITQVSFKQLSKQPWRQYMGSQGDNIYRNPSPIKPS